MAIRAIYRFRSSNFLILLYLGLCWIGGIAFGCSLYEPSSLLMMRSAIVVPVSIVGVFVCTFLPILCTYFSFTTEKPIIILIVCFFKAVAYGYTYTLIGDYYSTAAWLIHSLFLFSDSCLLFLLLFGWTYHFIGSPAQKSRILNICGLLIFIVSSANIYLISPLLEGLF